MSLDTMSFNNQTRNWKSVERICRWNKSATSCWFLLIEVVPADDSWLLRLLKNKRFDIRTATEDDQQQLKNMFIVIHFRSGGSISCLNTQHGTWNSN
ncbi:hypothetical protein F511_32359 [Dorcoceras hygrometricum]|uniref:Uncharacterized protein n=1 Tax=Dorcoceras hygrometricum TaxID=472368 RepID=A0A2Z7A8S6_9LAMI|nr:hypothetical protein F511_32359 [Dorcoceras hygrometricum]